MNKLHLSFYTIPVKLENEPGKYLLVHGYTGAIDLISSDCWKQLSIGNYNNLSERQIQTLRQRGYLTERKFEEEQEYVIHLASLLHKSQAKLNKFWGFIITYNCNFRCPYCFENEVSHNGCQWKKSVFTESLVDKAYKAMLDIEPHQELHKKEILLYGGEPLLQENKSIVQYIIQKGHKLGYKFKVITNGYDIDSYKDILTTDYFTNFQITIDGYREYHNTRRKHFLLGEKTFDKIISNISLLLTRNIDITVRLNLDDNNFQDIEILKKYFKEIGYMSHPHFKLSPAVLVEFAQNENQSNNIKYISNNLFQDKIMPQLEDLNCSKDYGIYQKFFRYFTNKACCHLTATACPAQYGTFMFDPDGDIYTCLEIVGKKEYSIGHYNSGELQWTTAKELWFSQNVGVISQCKMCKYALLCGGKCLAKTSYVKEETAYWCTNYHKLFPKSVNKAYDAFINSIN